MKPVITTGCSSSRHAQREAPAPMAFHSLQYTRAPTTICSFHTNKAQSFTLVVPKGEDRQSGTEKANDFQKTGESSSDNYTLLVKAKTGIHDVEGASSWHGAGKPSARPSEIQGELSESSSADGTQAKGEETVPLALNLKLRLRKNPLKPTSKSMKAQQRSERRRSSKKEGGDDTGALLVEAQYQLQSQMEGMEAVNYDLQQSAGLALSELEALRAQVRDLQGSLQSGESENDRLQAELRCLRQSMQLEMPQLQTDKQGAEQANTHHKFMDFYEDSTCQGMDSVDFTELAKEFLLCSN